MKRQHSKYWPQFDDRSRERLRSFKYKLKTSLKMKYNKLLEVAPKSNITKNQKSRKRRNLRKKAKRLDELQQQASRVIVNKSDLVLSESDNELLLLGLSFILTPRPSASELEQEWTELNQHIRRVEWEHIFKTSELDEDGSSEDSCDDDEADNIPAKLQFVKHNRPNTDQIDEETKAYTDLCTAQLRNLKPKLSEQFQRRNNLSKVLQGSLKKLTSLAKDGDYVFCRSDKDGKIVIISREDFKAIMQRELLVDKIDDMNSEDAQDKLGSIKLIMEDMVKKLHLAGGISDKMLLHCIGMYRDSVSNNLVRVKKAAKYFTVGKPGYSSLLFKTHKLNQEDISTVAAQDIPVRLVSAISNITTSRCTSMLEFLLKPISIDYCKTEYTRDSSHYLQALIEWKQRAITVGIDPKNIHLIAGDIQSLYPSCKRELVRRALQQALSQSNYTEECQQLIIDLAMFCMENVLTQFEDNFFSQTTGIITGDNDSVSIANIAMRFIMLSASETLQTCELVKRFIDDIMIIFIGTLQEADTYSGLVHHLPPY